MSAIFFKNRMSVSLALSLKKVLLDYIFNEAKKYTVLVLRKWCHLSIIIVSLISIKMFTTVRQFNSSSYLLRFQEFWWGTELTGRYLDVAVGQF